jgi:hypothetical protein
VDQLVPHSRDAFPLHFCMRSDQFGGEVFHSLPEYFDIPNDRVLGFAVCEELPLGKPGCYCPIL